MKYEIRKYEKTRQTNERFGLRKWKEDEITSSDTEEAVFNGRDRFILPLMQ